MQSNVEGNSQQEFNGEKLEKQQFSQSENDSVWYRKDWLSVISNSRDCQLLSEINLNHCRLTDENFKAVTVWFRPELIKLTFSDNKVTKVGVKELISIQCQQLQKLSLGWNNIGCIGAKLLAKITMPLIQTLWLNKCRLGSQGVRHMPKGKWPNLRQLCIYYNEIGFDGYETITKGDWQQLTDLQIHNYNQQTYNQFDEPISMLALTTLKTTTIRITTKVQNEQLVTDISNMLERKGMEVSIIEDSIVF